VPSALVLLLALLLAAGAAGTAAAQEPPPAEPAPPPAPRVELLGRSVQGRPIAVTRLGDPAAPAKVLIVGCVHGDECAGRAVVADLLARPAGDVPAGVELLLVRNINPDGFQRRTRGNAHGVDLNRNAREGWRTLRAPTYSGPGPFSEPESRAIRGLILAARPVLTAWYHQPLRLVDVPEDGAPDLSLAYAGLTGLPLRRLPAYPGSLSRWQNARVRPGSSLVVELPAGPLRAAAAARHAGAVLNLAAGLAAAPTGAARSPA